MQSHFNVPPTDSSPNPLSDPDLMASLLVPHIEAFLANNTSTRLLILHYSAADLPIVFALRRLLGADLLKISGILDTLASDPVPTSFVEAIPQPLTPSSPNAHPLSNQNTIPRRSSARLTSGSTRKQQGSTSTPLDRKSSLASSQTATRTSMAEKRFTLTASFAKADYLLPSTATDAEIVAFLAGIWKSLVERSAFYTPEPEPEPKTIIVERPPMPPPPTISPPVTRDRDSGYPPSSYAGSRSKVSRLTGGAPSSRADSITSTIRGTGHAYSASVATTRNGYAQSIASHMTTASERGRRDDKEWENFYIAEEDSEDDDYDKMILGRAMARIVPEVKKAGQKRNTKKALKWLGLA